ncbi:hypothetical protein EON67_01550, partial [archaeon]
MDVDACWSACRALLSAADSDAAAEEAPTAARRHLTMLQKRLRVVLRTPHSAEHTGHSIDARASALPQVHVSCLSSAAAGARPELEDFIASGSRGFFYAPPPPTSDAVHTTLDSLRSAET